MIGTCPYIAYALGVGSRTLEDPHKNDWIWIKRIFLYLKETSETVFKYVPGFKRDVLKCYSNADHKGNARDYVVKKTFRRNTKH